MSKFIINLTLTILGFYAIVQDIINDSFGWALADFLLFPMGILRGFLMAIGAI